MTTQATGRTSVGVPVPPMSSDCSVERPLLERLRRHEDAAFEELVRAETPHLLAVARRFLRHEEDAQDTVQQSFLLAFRALPEFQGQCRLTTWLHRIVTNTALMKLRSRARKPEQSIESLLPRFSDDGHQAEPMSDWSADAEGQLERSEVQQRVRAAIDDLPEPYRTVLLMRDIEELDTEETARLLGISVGAVKTRLHRARQALASLLQPVFGGRRTA